MDPADRADEQQQIHLDSQIQRIRANASRPTNDNKTKGVCNFCHERIDDEKVFCDVDCAEDFERLQRAKSQRRF